ncbi:DUF6362 family protein [Rhodoplanes sp. Z2-YC6860]|uniref:DUF6362 family protein n=1 Tax=Rhodoplanes sp. Z2-YC6860 TaxID=674703 RepID=UPI003FA68F0B
MKQRLLTFVGASEHPDWLDWVNPDDVELVIARARRTRWKPICLKFGVSRATAHRKWQRSIETIVARLNGIQPAPRRRWRRRHTES